jgi:hypothetical protein
MDYDNAANKRGEWSHADLAEGYREMAADRQQEMEAEEWTEALIGDILEVDPAIAEEEGFEGRHGLKPVP